MKGSKRLRSKLTPVVVDLTSTILIVAGSCGLTLTQARDYVFNEIGQPDEVPCKTVGRLIRKYYQWNREAGNREAVYSFIKVVEEEIDEKLPYFKIFANKLFGEEGE